MATMSMTSGYLHLRHKENSTKRTLVVYHLQKVSRKSGWNVNGTRIFRSFQWKISLSNGKGSLVLPVGMSKQTFVFHFFKAIFDTSLSF